MRRPTIAASDDQVFALTDKGVSELKGSGTSLAAAELELLVLIDGEATVKQIAQSAPPGMTREAVGEALRKLFAARLITSAEEPSADGLSTGFFAISVPAGFFTDASKQAGPEAEQGVSSLKQQGYFVRIARRPAHKREVQQGWRPTVFVIDDDMDLLKLVSTYFKLEGFKTRIATKKAEIMAGFRQQPMPDLVLLDISLPDADGFEVLARMREHPALKSMPVIVLTGAATRESVAKGLRAGADGYITKPFEPDALVTAVKEVLGLQGEKRPAGPAKS